MRKWLIPLIVVSLLLIPMLAHAQSGVTIGELTIQLWPEFDRPDMLVMYVFSLSEEASLPIDLEIRIPTNADLTAVAKDGGGTMINVPYDALTQNDDWIIVTLTITDLAEYRVEYYEPIEKKGTTRQFDFIWQSDYAVEALNVEFQQPPSATALQLAPLLPDLSTLANGNNYYHGKFTGVNANEAFTFSLSYNKDDETLMPIEAAGMQDNTSEPFALTDSLPVILVSAGVLLIVGGLLYFFLTGRSSNEPKQRKRHTPSTSPAGENVYCHECGSRASSSDKFCRACGSKLRI